MYVHRQAVNTMGAKKMEKTRRTKRLNLRVSEDDFRVLMHSAESCGMSMSDFVRSGLDLLVVANFLLKGGKRS